jgi:hypothetical protein
VSARTEAYQGQSDIHVRRDNIEQEVDLTLTAIIYAIVAKVVRPARSSVEKFASGFSSGFREGER